VQNICGYISFIHSAIKKRFKIVNQEHPLTYLFVVLLVINIDWLDAAMMLP